MIFFFCGAPKNGSHFQWHIVEEALWQVGRDYTSVAENETHRRDLGALRPILRYHADSPRLLFMKGHFGFSARERDLLLDYPSIKIFHIWRDIRDTLVSTYFYAMNRGDASYRDFTEFFLRHGKNTLQEQLRYRSLWDLAAPQVVHSHFSDLVQDFETTVKPLLDFAGVEGVDTQRLHDSLKLERLRKKYKDDGSFYRKGRVGEYSEVITDQGVLGYIEQRITEAADTWQRPELFLR